MWKKFQISNQKTFTRQLLFRPSTIQHFFYEFWTHSTFNKRPEWSAQMKTLVSGLEIYDND